MTITAKVIARSVSVWGKEIWTLQLRYPRFIHAEFMTHRQFSRNASSSRAIPVPKMLDGILADIAAPVHWGKNQAGMQAHEELTQPERIRVQALWDAAARSAVDLAQQMHDLGAHKQVVNRITEPFQHISVIVTATEWENFFALRDHPDAQPEIKALAQAMRDAMAAAEPARRLARLTPEVDEGDVALWHLPYVTDIERQAFPKDARFLCELSAARCARVSYLTHDGDTPSHEKDRALFDRLVGSKPLHASPIEHQAMVAASSLERSRNFRGYFQFRDLFEQEEAVLEPR